MYDMFEFGDLHSSNQNKTINFVWKKMTPKVVKTEVKYYVRWRSRFNDTRVSNKQSNNQSISTERLQSFDWVA